MNDFLKTQMSSDSSPIPTGHSKVFNKGSVSFISSLYEWDVISLGKETWTHL